MPSTAERARTMLALLQQLEPGADVPLEELAEAVGTTPERVAHDVTTLSMCGVAPYDPLSLVSAFVDEDRVVMMAPPPALERPVRLSPAEARALATALQSAGFDTHAELTERLMEAAAQDFSAEELAARVRSADPAPAKRVYETLASAATSGSVVTIDYQRVGETESRSRDIEPLGLFNDRGVWYVSAYCRRARGHRTFRLDRIRAAEATDETFDPAGNSPALMPFEGEGLPLARVVFSEATEYSERDWPGSAPSDEQPDSGALAVDVPYAGTAWISRQVCARMGTVTIEAPDAVREAVAATAERIRSELASR
jgi:proteasome accessory factor C